MSSVAVSKRIAAIGAELEALLAEPLIVLSAAERTAAAHEWETLTRRLPAMTHRLVAALAEVPTEELGEPTLAAAVGWPPRGSGLCCTPKTVVTPMTAIDHSARPSLASSQR
jgi:hypothetical protein